jgi:hypothetical protein
MSNVRELPTPPRRRRRRRPSVAALVAAASATAVAAFLGAGVGGRARADDLILQGPHPELKHNAVSVQLLMGHGFGDSFSGSGVGVGYGLMLRGPLWLDLQMNVRAASCSVFTGRCGTKGSDAEILAGVAWRFRTDIPVVPYVRGLAGLLYLFPEGADSAVGIGARGGAGMRYYIWDWFGLGIELGLSVGHGFYGDAHEGSRTHAVGDVALGVEAQFR